MMNQSVILGIVRHVLTTAGGVLITKGVTDNAGVEAIVGGLVAAVGVVWSIFAKRNPSNAAPASK
jgi:hypothetical protein